MRTITFLDSPQFRKDVLQGIKDLAQITAQTLGPGGRPILLEQGDGTVLSTKDGVTVAQAFAANGPVQKLVAQAAVEASQRTVRQCGDGTTTSLVLAAAITEAGQEWLTKNPMYSPQRLARELKDSFNSHIKPIVHSLSKPIRDLPPEESRQAIWHVAMVSANFDESIANAVTEAVEMVGADGMVQVEEGAGGIETTVEHKSGFPLNSGLSDLGGSASAAFVNRKAFGDCVLSGAYICLYDGEINDVESLVPLLERVSKEVDGESGIPVRAPLVVVAHGFGDTVLRVFAQNFRQQTITVVPLITPRSGQAHGRQQFLYDLNAYVGGQVFDPQGNPLKNAQPSNIGFCDEVKIGVSESVMLTEPIEDLINQRIDELKIQMNGASEFDRDKIRYRIGQLTGGVATIYSAGATAFEARERRDRVVDAVSSVRSALEFGVVPGGGAALLHVTRHLPNVGHHQIFIRALSRPFTQILLNAGLASNEDEALYMGNEVGATESGQFFVFDALKGTPIEWWSSGIFDATKVTLNALANALSVSQLLMTTGGAIARTLSDGEVQAKAMEESLMRLKNGE